MRTLRVRKASISGTAPRKTDQCSGGRGRVHRRDEPVIRNGNLWGLKTPITTVTCCFVMSYAARSYSLSRPPRIGLRRMRRCSTRSMTVAGGRGGDRFSARCGRLSLWCLTYSARSPSTRGRPLRLG